MKLLGAQFNFTVGDIAKNTQLICDALTMHSADADVLVCPELCLTGYPPEDLLYRPELYERVEAAIEAIKPLTEKTAVIVGHPMRGKHLGNSRTDAPSQHEIYNQLSVIYQGNIIASYSKQSLPNYNLFDEKRYFTAGTVPTTFSLCGQKIGLLICEDLWEAEPIAAYQACALVICINASPFAMGKLKERNQLIKERSQSINTPLFFVNCVGGQDEVVFDGGSVYCSPDRWVQAPLFQASCFDPAKHTSNFIPNDVAQVYQALVLGVQDYVNKNGFPGAIIGLSGGIDSALTLAIAVDALGAKRVQAVMMPSKYTASISQEDAEAEATSLNVQYDTLSIKPLFDSFCASLSELFAGLAPDVTEENLQARIRGTLLMALSNKSGRIILTTGNKSEMAVGYATLYGDMAGGFCVLKDIPKTLVYVLSRYRNTLGPVIPERVITRAPSAELAQDQTDQDSLPDYDTLDAIIQRYIENDESAETIIAAGFDADEVNKVTHLIKRNEYKRRQAPLGVRISSRAFGKDRRYPITSGF